MMYGILQGFPGGSGLLNSVAGLMVLVGVLVSILLLVALGAFFYRIVIGDGLDALEEADEAGTEGTDDEGVQRGDEDEEWKYY